MKRYSNWYPFIFGLSLLITGIALGQIWLAVIFGLGPMALAGALAMSDRKKKTGNRPPVKECCARCGVDLSAVVAMKVNIIGNKKYCDICGPIVSGGGVKAPTTPEPAKKPAPVKKPAPIRRPAPARTPAPTKRGQQICARCKTPIDDKTTVWIGNHRFCNDCARPGQRKPTPEQYEKMQAIKCKQMPSLINVLEQIAELKRRDMHDKVCYVCNKTPLGSDYIFVNGEYYCQDCFSFTYNNSGIMPAAFETELCQICYRIGGVGGDSLLSRVVNVADRLIMGGFEFCTAGVGGGVSDRSSATEAYTALYTSYKSLKSNMESDFSRREQEVQISSDGQIKAMNYSYIAAFLTRKTLKVCVLAQEDCIVFRWLDESDKLFPMTRVFVEEVIKELYDGGCMLEQIDNIEIDAEFLNNWL